MSEKKPPMNDDDYEEMGDNVTEELSEQYSHASDISEETDYRIALYYKTLASCGFGRFHAVLLLVCGWALASDSAEVQVVSFVVPTACDLHMTSPQKGLLNAIIFVGMMVGGYLLGGLADIRGRRYVLLWSLSINGLFGLLSAFAPTFSWFLAFRFMSGLGVGAAQPVIFSYCAEFVGVKRRGPVIGFLACFWMVGNIMTCVVAYFVLPNVEFGKWINIGTPIYFGSWRLFVILGAVPSISSVFLMYLLPESPMFLQKMKQYEDAKDVFTKMATWNFGKNNSLLEIYQYSDYYKSYSKASELSHELSHEAISSVCAMGLRGKLFKIVAGVVKSTVRLFVRPYLRSTLILIIIWFTLSFGYYGLWMWFPEIFKRVESAAGGSTCGGGGMNANSTSHANITCQQQTANGTHVYMESLFVALSNIPGNLGTILLVNKLGRRPLMALSMIASAASVGFLPFVSDRVQMIIMSCVFSGMSVAGWNVLDMLSIENYPTDLRSTAFGVQSLFGRVGSISGNVAFGAMVDDSCALPLLIVAGLLTFGGLTTLMLPKTDDASLS